MYNNIKKEINISEQIKKGEIVDIFYHDVKIKNNCLILEVVQDYCFEKGLIIYLNGITREIIDLENKDGLWIQKISS